MNRFNRVVSLLILSTLFLNQVWAGPISPEEAAEIAARFTNSQPQLMKRHNAPRKAANMRLAHKALQNNSQEAAFYVFNQENSNGFVIVSADDRTAEEVLGYGEHGSFDVNKINPNLRWWLNRYAEEITALQTIDDSEFYPESAARKAVQVEVIGNLLKNKDGKEITWYQETPYSNLCPMDQRDNTRCLTGCVATAASQIMYKWTWPTKGTGSTSYTWYDCMDDDCNNYKTKTLSVEPGNTTYDWDNMLPAYEGKSYTDAQANAVATLMYQVGVAAKMGYGGEANNGSGAWTDDMGYALINHFGYKLEKFITMYSKNKYKNAKGTDVADITAEFSVTRDQFTSYFNADLEAGRPILMGGEGNSGGHEFVCCGRDANNKFYINWGWEGDSNGYFTLSSLRPGSYNFSSNLDALIGLCPKKDLPKVTVTWSVEGITSTTEFTQEDELVLPTNPADCESGKVFVGWTANSTVEDSKPADLFTSGKGKTVMEAITYYAVFAMPEGGDTYSDYSTSCGTPCTGDLTGITINTDNVKKTFKEGETFTSEGLVVKADYEGCKSKTVTSKATVSSPDMSQVGKQTVTVTFEEKTASYEITINAREVFTVNFYCNGKKYDTQSVKDGLKATKPKDPAASCSQYNFEGWYTAELAEDNTNKPAYVTDFTITKNQNFYAIFSKTEASGKPATDYEKISTLDELTDGNYVVAGNSEQALKAEVYNNYYLSTTAVSPADGVISNPAANIVWKITRSSNKVSFYNEKTSQYAYLYQSGTHYNLGLRNNSYQFKASVSGGNWTFEANEYSGKYMVYFIYNDTPEFAAKSSVSNSIQLYKQGEGNITYYTSVLACGTTAVENLHVAQPTAVKAILNGQIVIIRGEAMYSITGERIR